jgi:hypothetical protein
MASTSTSFRNATGEINIEPSKVAFGDLWYKNENSRANLTHIDQCSVDGFCYVRLLAFCCDLARRPYDDFVSMVETLTEMAGENPASDEALTSVMTVYIASMLGTKPTNSESVQCYDRLKGSSVRVPFERDNETGKYHIGQLRSLVTCDCEFYICEHGMGFSYVAVLCSTRPGTIGASNFDLSEFMGNPCQEEFVDNTVLPEMKPDHQPSKVSARKQKRFEPRPLEPKDFRVPRQEVEDVQESISPLDSSSQFGRYSKRFLDYGTVLSDSTLRQQITDKLKVMSVDDGSILEMDNQLIKGHYSTEELKTGVTESIDQLQPINGLPRPFTNARLNFLMNLHTAIEETLELNKGSYLSSVIGISKTKSVKPHVKLLKTVIRSSFDLKLMHIQSNCFRLPYINVGMAISEKTLCILFDLLRIEYKTSWFDEFKGLKVPDFHGVYATLDGESFKVSKSESRGKGRQIVYQERKASSSKRPSLLGF